MASEKRVNLDQIIGPADAKMLEHNRTSGSGKVLTHVGFPVYLGDGTTHRDVSRRGAIVMVWNTGAVAIGYVKFGADHTITAPAAPGTDIVPIAPSDYITFCIGPNVTLIGSSASIHIYEIQDDTALTNTP